MKASIDRIDDGIAVLLPLDDGNVRVTLPASALPAGSREGDIVTITLERDEAATGNARERVAGLIRKLGKTP